MSTQTPTLDEIRAEGLKALALALGAVGMVKFLQQFETGRGDYSVERDQWLEPADVRQLTQDIRQRRKTDEAR